jgi:Helicase HerA, central domain/TraM recognition site of TraD and TraG
MEPFQFQHDCTILGTVFTHAGEEEYVLSEADCFNHMLVIGKTGMGKTTFLKNLILQDIYASRGVGVIDPHGDLTDDLLEQYPRWRARELVYINPSDQDRVVTFNVLANVPRDRIAVAASNLVGSLKAIWSEFFGPRMERILYFAVAALIEAPNTSFLGLPRFLKNADYRARVLDRVSDPMVRSFFSEEYDVWDADDRTAWIDPVLNKVEIVLASPIVRAMLGTPTSSIDFADIMDNRKVLIADLSKGLLGPSHAHLLGALLTSGFLHAAMARRDIEANRRVPFFLKIDEFQNFSTDNFKEILSEARKYKLALALAHQYLRQATDELRAAVLGNVGTIVAFQLSGADAKTIADELGLRRPSMLTELAIGEVWTKHPRFGGPSFPKLLRPIPVTAKGKEPALKQNRLRNTFPRDRIERRIQRFLDPQPKSRRERHIPFDPWPHSLAVFRRALRSSLASHATTIHIADDVPPVTAVNIEHVKREFIAMQVSDAGTVDERAEDRDKVFRRALRLAQQRRLLGALERDGTQWVWPIK